MTRKEYFEKWAEAVRLDNTANFQGPYERFRFFKHAAALERVTALREYGYAVSQLPPDAEKYPWAVIEDRNGAGMFGWVIGCKTETEASETARCGLRLRAVRTEKLRID